MENRTSFLRFQSQQTVPRSCFSLPTNTLATVGSYLRTARRRAHMRRWSAERNNTVCSASSSYEVGPAAAVESELVTRATKDRTGRFNYKLRVTVVKRTRAIRDRPRFPVGCRNIGFYG